MKTVKQCSNCKTELVIEENELIFPEEKNEEKGYCPICNKLVYTGKTDGWYFVGVNSKDPVTSEKCVYPMP